MRLEKFCLETPHFRIPSSVRMIHPVINDGIAFYNQYFFLGGNTAGLSRIELK